ncbi:MAG: PepSY-like domain-containing protein [Muribaculaceae bacterium]|nr:PepSY-like domain-containing protein [Muribaculaceae bacterium]MDE6320758.1 PepSY-like domain-containing protein [Muribaculaceae bacterium]
MIKRCLLALAVATIGCVGFTACNDDNDDNMNVAVTPQYVDALKAMYPQARITDWDAYPPYYVAECVIDGSETDVWFGPDAAVWAMTETDIGMSPLVLPDAVQSAFNTTEYAGAAIEDIEKFERPDVTFYVIECEPTHGADVDVYITEDGYVTQVLTDTDAVIYPNTPIGL